MAFSAAIYLVGMGVSRCQLVAGRGSGVVLGDFAGYAGPVAWAWW